MTHARARTTRTRRTSHTAGLAAVLLVASGCSLVGGSGSSSGGGDGRASDRVVLLTHDSFSLPDELVDAFEADTGLDLVIRAVGDGGTLTNRLVLSKDEPEGDVVYGIDNTFASRALDAGVLAPYADAPLPSGSEDLRLDGDGRDRLAPVDVSDVCVNVDDAWFTERDRTPPRTLDDLRDPAYRDLFVTPAATTSSPGLAFLLTTIAAYGEDGWQDYWRDLVANGATITADWEGAYQTDFTAGGGSGSRPVVLSYDSSPAFTVSEDGSTSTTSALLDTCFQQVEYTGVLTGADNSAGARQVVDWLLSDAVQAALPESMYVFPAADDVALPETWAKHAVRPEKPWSVDPARIEADRETWLREWTDVTSG